MEKIRADIQELKGDIKGIHRVLRRIATVQGIMTESLQDHMKRTNLLEEKLLPLADDKMFKDRVWNWCGKIVVTLATLTGLGVGVIEIIQYFK